jgi:hypothetical protein
VGKASDAAASEASQTDLFRARVVSVSAIIALTPSMLEGIRKKTRWIA